MAKRNAYEVYKSLQRSGNTEKSLKERNKQNNIVDLYNFLEERNARDGVRGASFEDKFIGS